MEVAPTTEARECFKPRASGITGRVLAMRTPRSAITLTVSGMPTNANKIQNSRPPTVEGVMLPYPGPEHCFYSRLLVFWIKFFISVNYNSM